MLTSAWCQRPLPSELLDTYHGDWHEVEGRVLRNVPGTHLAPLTFDEVPTSPHNSGRRRQGVTGVGSCLLGTCAVCEPGLLDLEASWEKESPKDTDVT